MVDKVAKITTPIHLDEVNAKDIMAAIWTSRIAFRPTIKATCRNDGLAALEDDRFLAHVKAKQTRPGLRERFDCARELPEVPNVHPANSHLPILFSVPYRLHSKSSMSESTPPEPNARPVLFTYNFSQLSTLASGDLPPDSSSLWQTISDPCDPVTFAQLLSRIAHSPDTPAILSAFGLSPPVRHILTTELRRHLSYLDRILPPAAFLAYIAGFRLDLAAFVASLPAPAGPLLSCAVHLLWAVLSAVESDQTRHEIMERFALLLLPRELLSQRRSCARPELRYLCFLPVESKDGRQWIALCSDHNKVQMFSMSKAAEAANWFTLDEVGFETFCNEIHFSNPTRAAVTYTFSSRVDAQLWEDAATKRSVDPIYHFIACLPSVFENVDCAPPELLEQLTELLTAPDMDFLHSFLKTAATRGQEQSKGAVLSCLARLNDAQLLAPWFRAVFSIEITLLRSVQTIFRESSAASISSSVFLVNTGLDFSKMVADILLENSTQVDRGIRLIIGALDKVPAPLRLVFSACFKATRRKYKEKLVPIMAVSSFLMLRFLLPQFAMISPACSRLGQKLMTAFVFKKLPDDPLGEDLPQLIGNFLLEISTVEPADVQLPPYDAMKVLQFCAENAPLLADRVDIAKADDEHPLHWSMLELLESGIFGVKEDYAHILEGRTYMLV
jgi:hypothetical protein